MLLPIIPPAGMGGRLPTRRGSAALGVPTPLADAPGMQQQVSRAHPPEQGRVSGARVHSSRPILCLNNCGIKGARLAEAQNVELLQLLLDSSSLYCKVRMFSSVGHLYACCFIHRIVQLYLSTLAVIQLSTPPSPQVLVCSALHSGQSANQQHCCHAERNASDSRQLDFEEQEYWEGSGEELDMHEDDEEADMRTQEELMMQHRYMMVSSRSLTLLCCLYK